MKKQPRGRPRRSPDSSRGRAILRLIDGQGLTLAEAACRAGIAFATLYRLIHDDPGKQSVATVEAVCGRLHIPLNLVAPGLVKLAS